MTKILLINCGEEKVISDTNKGAEAVIVATVHLLRSLIPHAAFTSFLNCSEGLAQKLALRVIRMKPSPNLPRLFGEVGSLLDLLRCLMWAGINKYLRIGCSFLITNTRLREYADADVIIYLAMDYYTDDAGVRTVLKHSRDILLGVLLKKPVVIWAASTGPFRNRLSKFAVRFVLNRVSLIMVRDSLSRDFLLEVGVDKSHLYLTSDPAFLLSPVAKERVKETCLQEGIDLDAKVTIGVNPSHSFIVPSHMVGKTKRDRYLQLMSLFGSFLASLLPESLFNHILKMVKRSCLYSAVDAKYADYKTLFAQLIDWLVEEYGADVILIPHDQAGAQLFDDRVVTREIRELVRHKGRVVVVTGDYNAEEIKGIIGQCDLFIGARFHAAIAALSQGIPTVCFPYYHKFALLSELGQEKYICESYTLGETKMRVATAWENREGIREELESKLDGIRALAALNGELVRSLIAGEKDEEVSDNIC